MQMFGQFVEGDPDPTLEQEFADEVGERLASSWNF